MRKVQDSIQNTQQVNVLCKCLHNLKSLHGKNHSVKEVPFAMIMNNWDEREQPHTSAFYCNFHVCYIFCRTSFRIFLML